MAGKTDFQNTFQALKGVLQRYENRLTVVTDKPGNYYLNAAYSEKWKKDIFFGAVLIKKSYVSFHLMPVYMYPDLLKGVPRELKTRMHGKSCFNFKAIGSSQLKNIKALTRTCFQRLKSEGLV